MSLRPFTDSRGEHWQVWDVVPQYVTGGGFPNAQRPAAMDCGDDANELRGAGGLTGEMEDGWLCFESSTEKRRLHPIPRGWEERSDEELEALCGAAEPVRRLATAN
jgi:hypothetical protein